MSAKNVTGWLPGLLGPMVRIDGAEIATPRGHLNLVGASQEDDDVNDQVNVTLSAGAVGGITVSGTPNAGAVLRATSASAAAWGAVDLADSDAVTGTLPGGNVQASSGSNAGSMSSADKTKLDGIQKQGSTTAISALAIDWSLSTTFSKTISVSSTFTFSNATDGQCIIVAVTAGSGNTVTWPTVKWAGGVAPTQTSSGTDVYTFVKIGSTIYGSVVQAMA